MIAIPVSLIEVLTGPIGSEMIKNLREQGWTESPPIITRIIMDAKSVFESIRAMTFKAPSENGIAGHIFNV